MKMNSDEQDEQPVSFQELKKRWAEQESGSSQQKQQQRPSTSCLSNNAKTESTSALPPPLLTPASSQHSVSSVNLAGVLPPKPSLPRKHEPSPLLPPAATLSSPPPFTLSPPPIASERETASVSAEKAKPSTSKGPAVPPKPSLTTLSTSDNGNGTSSTTPSTPLVKKVSLLAQQFDNKSAPCSPALSPSNSTKPSVPAGTSTTAVSPPPPSPSQPALEAEDPFVDDEISDLSSCDSDDEDYVANDLDDINNLDNIRYNTTPSIYTPPPIDKTKQRPPPPPPSKKYHSSARQQQQQQRGDQVDYTTTNTGSSLVMPIPVSSQQQSTAGIVTTAPPPILPPRPSLAHIASVDHMPQLPPRPSTTTLARSHTINHSHDHGAHSTTPYQDPSYTTDLDEIDLTQHQQTGPSVNLKRSQTMGPMKRQAGSSSSPSALLTKSICPDFSHATRDPPVLDSNNGGERRLVGSQHRGANQPMAASGSKLATGTQQIKIWNTVTCRSTSGVDVVGPNDSDRIRSFLFTPPADPKEEGRYLWSGMQNGSILAMDTTTNEMIGKVTSCHKHAVVFMLRRRNVDVWTLDESGLLAIWPVLMHQEHPFEVQPVKHLVTAKATAALILGPDQLWVSSGRMIHFFRGLGKNSSAASSADDKSVRIPNDLGNITQLVTIPFHSGQIFASHDDGKVSTWDAKTMEKGQVNAVSLYGICAMISVGDYYLWTGYNTGMIYVYDTRPEKWLVVKTWRAHHGAVVSLTVDESSFISNEKELKVISGDSHGNVAIWDGLMVDNWLDQQLQKQAQNYCKYKPARVMICSWNIDANKPEKLVGQDDELVHEWLGEADKPDIIVVGIQEIVDLESKKQTAKSLFSTRKKSESLQEAEEQLTHRYRLWHDYLIRVIGDNYGHDAYTVIKTDQLVGLFSCVFVRSTEIYRVWNCDSTVVKTGLKVMNKSIHGNKGGIAIRLLFDHSSLCFVNCHLAAGQSHTQDRNANAESILHSANFPEHGQYLDVFSNGGDGSLILDHEHCFLSGDLNYRIALDRKDVVELLKRKDKVAAWETLQAHDQLKRQQVTNPLFKLLWFQEPPLLFDPTYKYDRGTDRFDSSEKKRVPAWCDRVLCRSNMAHNIYYRRHEVKASDHRPISAAYEIYTKEIDGQKRDRLLEKIESSWGQVVEQLVMQKKVDYVANYELCTAEQASQLLKDAHWDVEQVVQELFHHSQ